MPLIRHSVVNRVGPNMLMIMILGGGLLAGALIPREVFPEFELDMISITVPYPGAAPADVERGIVQKIEDQLTGLEGVEEMTSTSREGFGTVMLELYTNADVRKVLDEVKSEVDKITFPLDAEDPVVTEVTLKRHVVHVAVAGNVPERTRKELAEEIRDEINDLPEVSQVTVSGVRQYEIVIEVTEDTLRRLGLTHADIARTIRQSSFDLPAGTIKTRTGEMTVRVVAERLRAEQYKNIPVLYRPDGTIVHLGEIAVVREGFEDVPVGGQFNGVPAALVSVFQTGDEDTIRIAAAVRAYVARKQPTLPEGVQIEVWSDMSRLVQDRLSLLMRNGAVGLVLVFGVLWFFLRLRLSVWVAMGIPVSILGTLLVLFLLDMTLNMMSMFALIMALGLIVDDAIVVGENVYSRVEKGELPLEAAVEGTREVLLPVIGAVSTTWLAFLPLLLIPGIMGRFIRILPITVILALAFSLLECLIILPPHLAHWLKARREEGAGRPTRSEGVRGRVDGGIQWFIQSPFAWVYRRCARYRYVTVTVVLGILVVVGGAFGGGWIRVTGFPQGDSDTIVASLILPTGTPQEQTEAIARRISRGALALNEQFQTRSGEPLIQRVYSLIGQQSGEGGSAGSHVAEIIVELLPSERRGERLRSSEVTQAWRQQVGAIPEAISLTYGELQGGPRGRPIEIRLLGPSTRELEPLAERLRARLQTFAGVRDVEDDALPGKMEMQITPRPGAENLGAVLRNIAEQLRDAFYGNESLKIQRGRDEIKVMVRYPESERESLSNVEDMRIRLPSGAQAPFGEVADVRMQRGYTTLRRARGKSVITVSADVDEDVTNAEQILQELQADGVFADLTARVPGSSVDLRGQRQQIFESLDALKIWFPVALLGIYTILAAIFRSYLQPIIIMIAIPFGLVGAVVGHWLLGFDVTLLSMFGMVALAGIVVNDSLVLIDLANRLRREGRATTEAMEQAALQRFRPILLTTVTTVAGMGPMLLERSFQAQFLKPMVVSIAFGLIFATTLTLLVVPAMYLIGADLAKPLRWLKGKPPK